MNTMAGHVSVIWVLSCFVLCSTILVLAQDQTGFISIDCGKAANTSYTDPVTEINYVADDNYIDSGEKRSIAQQYDTSSRQRQLTDVRSFPKGNRSCYTLYPQQDPDTKYLIRAQFLYGNHDAKNDFPTFDLYIGANYWTTIVLVDHIGVVTAELLHAPLSNVLHICLVDTGLGTPFISVLELRPLKKSIYVPTEGSLNLDGRLDLGSRDEYRYPVDIYDRLWSAIDWSNIMTCSTYESVTSSAAGYGQPSAVMSTAITPIRPADPLRFFWKPADPTVDYYIYMHFAEIRTLAKNQLRGFHIYLNGNMLAFNFTPPWLSSFTLYTEKPLPPNTLHTFSFEMDSLSTLPPLLNAIELFSVRNMLRPETDPIDAQAVINIKSAYSLNKIWQGDPCSPRFYSWDGLNCSFTENDLPRIIALNLSNSNLNGKLSDYISDLKLLEQLDLSNNNLIGSVPDFLTRMTSLKYLNLRDNRLSGVVPSELVLRWEQGSLTLYVKGNKELCLSYPCSGIPSPTSQKKNIINVRNVAAAGGVFIFLIIIIMVIYLTYGKKKKMPLSRKGTRDSIETQNRRFTYEDVLRMTRNLSENIGEGGFGAVYLGYLDDGQKQVAVKMLSPSSSQGYKEFKAEAQLLMIVHHRNLVSLIGYCDDGDKLGLIYEYMANGDLQNHISDENFGHMPWEDRLRIAHDSALGLEYLHNGCKPPIVHRDIKPANILLNDKFEAKLADFGLSRTFGKDDVQAGSPSTMVAGTPGYLDPEYYMTQQLNEKSDIFSFGIVLLEIITSRTVMGNLEDGQMHISKWVSQVLSEEGDIKVIIDRRLSGEYDTNSAWKAVELAINCVSVASSKRPNMTEVVSELSQCLSMEKSRKKEGFTTDTIDSVEMLSFGLNNEYSPAAR